MAWSKAQRAQAAEHAKRGWNTTRRLKARETARLAVKARWDGMPAEERERLLGLLARNRYRPRNHRSDRARAAQRARGKQAYLHPTGAQALKLAELGYYKREAYAAPPPPNSDRAIYRPEMGPIPDDWLAGRPHPSEYPDSRTWRRAVDSWDCNEGRALKEAKWAAEAVALGEGAGGMDDGEDGEDDE